MKTTLLTVFAFCVFSSTALFAQSLGVATRDSQAHPLVMPSHVQNVQEGSLAPQHDVYVRNATTIGYGERPLWEFARPAAQAETPLGDVARLYRQQHATAKKAVKVLEK